jgi:hypothetical protein
MKIQLTPLSKNIIKFFLIMVICALAAFLFVEYLKQETLQNNEIIRLNNVIVSMPEPTIVASPSATAMPTPEPTISIQKIFRPVPVISQ